MKFFGKGDKARMGAKSCDHPLYRCGHCGETGCQSRDCDNRQFQEADLCRDCGRSWEMIPLGGAETNAPTATRPAPAKTSKSLPKLPYTEIVLGTMLVVTIVGFGLFAKSRDGLFAGLEPRAPVSSPVAAKAKTVSGDVCGCYDEAMRLSGKGLSVESSHYKTGFLMCREFFGVAGGDAWTAGWNARRTAKAYEASCKSYRRKT
ncbi:hypothetical protein ABFZ85_13105 [Hyphococcus formosus]|uniref:hypothetical protein n=1 Tax=Hyphococcus formosus TaxID=3143534 RepID=UPI00398B4D36